ncbi:MAG: hypothetical protein RIC55_20990 [Pirellulaceae bacterium]
MPYDITFQYESQRYLPRAEKRRLRADFEATLQRLGIRNDFPTENEAQAALDVVREHYTEMPLEVSEFH